MSHYFDQKTSFMEPKVTQHGNSMVMTNVVKPTKTKYINIDTRFTDEYTYNKVFNLTESYTITLPERINEVKSIKAISVEIPMSFYNISASAGNSFLKVVKNGTDKMLVIPDGNYTMDTLVTTLDGLTDANLALTNVNGNAKFVASGAAIELDFDTDICGNFHKYNFRSKLGWLLGFRDASYNLAVTPSLVSESMINVYPFRYLYLVVDEFNNGFPNSFVSPLYQNIMNKKILARICLDLTHYPFGTVLRGNESLGVVFSDTRTYSGNIDIHRLKVQLVNEWGNPVNLNGLDFSFLLEVEYD